MFYCVNQTIAFTGHAWGSFHTVANQSLDIMLNDIMKKCSLVDVVGGRGYQQ